MERVPHGTVAMRGTRMPAKIGSFESLSEEDFHALRQQKVRKTDPAMAALLAEIAIGQPVRVPLVDGQSAPGPAHRHQPGRNEPWPERGDRRGERLCRRAQDRRATISKREVAIAGRAAPAWAATEASGVRRRRVCLNAGFCRG